MPLTGMFPNLLVCLSITAIWWHWSGEHQSALSSCWAGESLPIAGEMPLAKFEPGFAGGLLIAALGVETGRD
jgi:hypothetical protein